MKKGYHSTQSKAFNTIPRSEYLGVVLGFAIGMFLTGALHWDNRILELIGAVAGFVVGWWIDGKYYAEKDIPADQLEAEQTTQESQKNCTIVWEIIIRFHKKPDFFLSFDEEYGIMKRDCTRTGTGDQ